MSVFLRGLSKVGCVLTIGVVVVFCAGCGTSALPSDNPGDAAQSNLFTALIASGTFYSVNHDSYVGIDGGSQLPASESSITGLGTGLAYVSGHQRSVSANIVSIYSPGPSTLVVTTLGARPRVCWGILSLKPRQNSPVSSRLPWHRQGWYVLLPRNLGQLRGYESRPFGDEHDGIPNKLNLHMTTVMPPNLEPRTRRPSVIRGWL